MMLTEETGIAEAALPVAQLKDHLRLGGGFADDGLQDGLLAGYLRAAIGAIEGRTGKALIARRFRLELAAWRGTQAQALPMAPVSAVVSVTLRDADGQGTAVDAAAWRLVPDLHRPRLAGRGGCLPAIPEEGSVEIVFDAGFGAAWADLPADLAQAVILLAAEFHERRHEMGLREAALPFGVMSLIERWRNVRLLAGGGR